MDPENDLCLCFHVPKHKIIKFILIEKPKRASQISQCQGAGTGCGWCRPFLERLFRDHTADLPDPSAYAAARRNYLKEKDRAQPNQETDDQDV